MHQLQVCILLLCSPKQQIQYLDSVLLLVPAAESLKLDNPRFVVNYCNQSRSQLPEYDADGYRVERARHQLFQPIFDLQFVLFCQLHFLGCNPQFCVLSKLLMPTFRMVNDILQTLLMEHAAIVMARYGISYKNPQIISQLLAFEMGKTKKVNYHKNQSKRVY